MNNLKLPYDKTLKYFGAYLDRTLTYWKHLDKTADKLKKRNFLIQKLTERSCGASNTVLKFSSCTMQ